MSLIRRKIMTYMGNTVKVNMTTGEIGSIPIDESITKQFLGGRGLGIRLLWKMTSPEMDAFSSETPLMFLTGPYTGTGVFSGFYNVTTLSPLTGSAVSAHSGGSFGPALKKAGYDGLVVVGRAEKPTYILL
jgi:aldehyde:ferredoxin oxidoreductase